MNDLVVALTTWISMAMGLPAPGPDRLPEVITMSQERMTRLHFGREVENAPVVLALYDSTMGRIYLGPDWDGTDIYDVSVLVHELVHHVQFENGERERRSCPAETEKLAYDIQDQFLMEVGKSIFLENDPNGFINKMNYFFLTRCLGF